VHRHKALLVCLVAALLATSAAARSRGRAAFVQDQRLALQQSRQRLRSTLEAQKEPATGAVRRYTTEVDRLVRALDRRIVRELGPAPVAYQLIALGSYARKEMAPYSDLDLGVLTSRSGPAAQRYFQRYGRRLSAYLRVIDGRQGLRLCGNMSPHGTHADALVDTPERLASRLAGRSEDFAGRPLYERDYLQSALSSTRPVLARGGGRLYPRFVAAARDRLGPPAPRMAPTRARAALIRRLLPSLREPFGLPEAQAQWGSAWLRGRSVPRPKDPARAIAGGDVNIKHDILRTLQTPVFILRALHGVHRTDTVGVLRQLARGGRIDAQLAGQLEQTFTEALRMRALHQLAAGRSDDRLGQLSRGEQRKVADMVPVLHRLRRGFDALGTADPNRFRLR
jgi:hypothetical protein